VYSMTWDDLTRIKVLTELPWADTWTTFPFISPPAEGCCAHPAILDLGVMEWPYRVVQFEVANLGPVDVRIVEARSSDETMVGVLGATSLWGFIPPLGSRRVSALVRAAGLTRGAYRADVSFKARRAEFDLGACSATVSFVVEQYPIFRPAVFPPVISGMEAVEGSVSLECCNYSDAEGTLIISQSWLDKSRARAESIRLKAREIRSLRFEAPVLRGGRERLEPAVLVTNPQTAVTIRIPITTSGVRP
jgi:hypothetical protein